MNKLNNSDKIILFIKEFQLYDHLSTSINDRISLEPLLPEIHEVMYSEEQFDKALMNIQLRTGKKVVNQYEYDA